MTRLLSAALVAALAIGASGTVAADPQPNGREPAVQLTPEQLREASAIFGETWSPFCPGRTLASCTSRAASEWRQDVREWLAKGATREEVMDRLRERRPNFQFETIPNTEGMRYGPWVLGGLFLAILAALGVFHARRSAGPTGGEASPVPAAPAVDRRALDRELEALED